MAAGSAKRFLGLPLRKVRFWGLVVLAIAFAVAFFFSADGVWRTLVMRRSVENKAARVDSLAQMNRLIRGRISALKAGDPKAIEEEARAHGMIKPGEKVFIFEEKPDKH